jgi:hypothetical protein
MSPRTAQIAKLNDQLRATFLTGKVVLTEGIASLEDHLRVEVATRVKDFTEFSEANDPRGEHDFGAFEVDGVGRVFWKIDYYDLGYEGYSEDASDSAVTNRVLTIMLAREY